MKAVPSFVALAVLSMGASLTAQWARYPTPGIPRTDGKPTLSAPAPRTANGKPDLSGMWQMHPGSYVVNVAQDLAEGDIQPWAQRRYLQHLDEFAKSDPACYLPSGPRYFLAGQPKIIQTPVVVAILNDDLTYRQIFLDGRALPRDPNPNFMGYSAGRWEGDVLVVESIGLNDRTLLDTGGHPHTEALHVTERFHRRDFGHMDVQVTFSDPEVYARPMVVPVTMDLVADDELIEYVCRENEKDYAHIVGRASDGKVDVAAEVLSRYGGTYEVRSAQGQTTLVTVTFEQGQLFLDRTPWMPGKDRQALIPLSETTFTGHFGRRMRFDKDDRGVPVRLIFEAPEPYLRDLIAEARK